MYRFLIVNDSLTGSPVEHILRDTSNGLESFPNVQSNDGPERAAYLEWVAEGNTPEPWNPT